MDEHGSFLATLDPKGFVHFYFKDASTQQVNLGYS